MKESKVNLKEIAEAEREDITMSDLQGDMRQLMSHPSEPKRKERKPRTNEAGN